ncbi:MAG TPA: cellulose binding domain-containing protein [Pilimelia sp.]|nr:cellulose binding domain-containing protein [Pilimelia sp.]
MPRRLRLLAAVAVAVVAAGAAAVALSPESPTDELCGRADTLGVNANQHIVMNNVWGAPTTQCIEVQQAGDFRITRSEHANTGPAAAAYPTIYAGCHWGTCTASSGLPLRVDRISSARSTWSVDTNAPGAWNAAYDLWFHTNADVHRSPDGAELMIWLSRAGAATPGGSVVARGLRIAGATWDLWYADWGWNYLAYVRTSPATSADGLDLHAFTADAVARRYVEPSWFLSGVEAGFEIWRGGAGLASRAFSVDARADAEATPAPSLLAAPTASASPRPTASRPPSPAATSAAPPSRLPTAPPIPTVPAPPRTCAVRLATDEWASGRVANMTVTNLGPPITNWALSWSFGGAERIVNAWESTVTQNGSTATARSLAHNGKLATGASTTFGVQATHTGTPAPLSGFALNGSPCRVDS